ncbi:MAG: efflux RND transporter permease subunit [Bernardetiaceae bacterium]
MLHTIIQFSIRNKLLIGVFILLWVGIGLYSAANLPLDAVPDITNNQVQVVTVAPSLTPQEIERFVTLPIELNMAYIPDVEDIRSVSKFGLSIVTVIFKDHIPTLQARQFVTEQLSIAQADIPDYIPRPQLMPITTGLGEVYQYTLRVKENSPKKYSLTELREIQDWIIKRQLTGIEGIVEVSSFGGFLKQYEVSVSPEKLRRFDLTIQDLYLALSRDNQNAGGGYIEKNRRRYYIRAEARYQSLDEIRQTLVKKIEQKPILIGDIAEVKFGKAPRLGAMTQDGKGEAVGGIVLMLKGANAFQVVARIEERVARIQKHLPEGIEIYPYLVRTDLIGRAIKTVSKNLIEGGLIVVFVLVLLLGNLRAGLVVASVIPLSLLFALTMMHIFGVSANLMSLGAIDFGLIVDGSVIIVEHTIHFLHKNYLGKKLNQSEMDQAVSTASGEIRTTAAFGEIIILIVYLPILSLVGVEGKMFQPMAQTVIFAILGAFILSLTYVPTVSTLLLQKHIQAKVTLADKIIQFLQKRYAFLLRQALRFDYVLFFGVLLLFIGSLAVFLRMGGEFIPTLEEGDLAMQVVLPSGAALDESVRTSDQAARLLLDHFPEVKHVVAKIGTAEIPTDPMSIEDADVMILLHPKAHWVSAPNREALVEQMKAKLALIPYAAFEFSQPIELRFNELITGAKSDVAIKIYGEDLNILLSKAKEVEKIIQNIKGIGDLRVEQVSGLPQIIVRPRRDRLLEYGMSVEELNQVLETAFAGATLGKVYEGERSFDLVLRLNERDREDIEDIRNLFIKIPQTDFQVPLSELAVIEIEENASQISRENTRRRINIGINVRNRDIEGLVNEISQTLDQQLQLPAGYDLQYGGQFAHLKTAKKRLSVAVPVALCLILLLLYLTFDSAWQALLIFTAVPFSSIGGIWSLWLRDMPFSISAGIGFIALFGVAVLNGIVLIGRFNDLQKMIPDINSRIMEGCTDRLRPVLMTAATATLGFLPMALSTEAGAEVQKPLATVVIGGLLTATVLTLFILPIIYRKFNR